MNAQALICDEEQSFSIESVILMDPAPDQVVIRTWHTGVSIGTEFGLIRNKLSWGPYPLCTGYMGTGIIEAVGSEVSSFQVGDEVYFRRNDAMSLGDGTSVSCVSGTHCSYIVTRADTTDGVDHVVAGAAMDVACMFVMPASLLSRYKSNKDNWLQSWSDSFWRSDFVSSCKISTFSKRQMLKICRISARLRSTPSCFLTMATST